MFDYTTISATSHAAAAAMWAGLHGWTDILRGDLEQPGVDLDEIKQAAALVFVACESIQMQRMARAEIDGAQEA